VANSRRCGCGHSGQVLIVSIEWNHALIGVGIIITVIRRHNGTAIEVSILVLIQIWLPLNDILVIWTADNNLGEYIWFNRLVGISLHYRDSRLGIDIRHGAIQLGFVVYSLVGQLQRVVSYIYNLNPLENSVRVWTGLSHTLVISSCVDRGVYKCQRAVLLIWLRGTLIGYVYFVTKLGL